MRIKALTSLWLTLLVFVLGASGLSSYLEEGTAQLIAFVLFGFGVVAFAWFGTMDFANYLGTTFEPRNINSSVPKLLLVLAAACLLAGFVLTYNAVNNDNFKELAYFSLPSLLLMLGGVVLPTAVCFVIGMAKPAEKKSTGTNTVMKVVSVVAFMMFAGSANAQEKWTLELVSEVTDGKTGFVEFGNLTIHALRPGQTWQTEVPHWFAKWDGRVQVTMCETYMVLIIPPPAWAMNPDTAGPYAITPAFVASSPVPVEIAERAASIIAYLGMSKHPDVEDMTKKMTDWVKRHFDIPVGCDDPVELTADVKPSGPVRKVTLHVRGKRGSYRLEQ